jgi:hypothetical protein
MTIRLSHPVILASLVVATVGWFTAFIGRKLSLSSSIPLELFFSDFKKDGSLLSSSLALKLTVDDSVVVSTLAECITESRCTLF